MSKPRLCALLAAALAITAFVAPAGAEGPGPRPNGEIPAAPCAVGQIPSQEHPCRPPVCPPGVAPTMQAPCIPPMPVPPPGSGQPSPGPGPAPTGDFFCPPKCPGPPNPNFHPGGPDDHAGHAPCGPGAPQPTGAPNAGNAQGSSTDQGGTCGTPEFMPGFVSRVWRFTADVDAYDAATNVLSATITKVVNLPARMSKQDDQIVDQDAAILVGPTTKIIGADGKRIPLEARYDLALDNANSVTIAGKLLKPSQWQKDQDGAPRTTIRAKRIVIDS